MAHDPVRGPASTSARVIDRACPRAPRPIAAPDRRLAQAGLLAQIPRWPPTVARPAHQRALIDSLHCARGRLLGSYTAPLREYKLNSDASGASARRLSSWIGDLFGARKRDAYGDRRFSPWHRYFGRFASSLEHRQSSASPRSSALHTLDHRIDE